MTLDQRDIDLITTTVAAAIRAEREEYDKEGVLVLDHPLPPTKTRRHWPRRVILFTGTAVIAVVVHRILGEDIYAGIAQTTQLSMAAIIDVVFTRKVVG